MTDPVTSKIALQHLQQTKQVSQEAAKATTNQPSFEQVMAQKQNPAPVAEVSAQAVAPSENAQRLDRFVEDVLKDEKKIERLMKRSSKGIALDQAELIQLQGLIYGYAQKVDLASKVVDKSTGGLKQIMNTQV